MYNSTTSEKKKIVIHFDFWDFRFEHERFTLKPTDIDARMILSSKTTKRRDRFHREYF